MKHRKSWTQSLLCKRTAKVRSLEKVLKALQEKEAEELKLQEEDRISKLEKQIGEINSTLNTFMAEMRKSIETVTGKIVKFEEAPEYKKLDVPPVKTTHKPLTTLNAIEGF